MIRAVSFVSVVFLTWAILLVFVDITASEKLFGHSAGAFSSDRSRVLKHYGKYWLIIYHGILIIIGWSLCPGLV